MKRPSWIPVKMWKEWRESYPAAKPLPKLVSGKVRRAPRVYSGWDCPEEFFSVSVEGGVAGLDLRWETGTGQRGNDWKLHITEEQLLNWLAFVRLIRAQKASRKEWEESNYVEALHEWLKHNKPEDKWDLYEVNQTLEDLDRELHGKAVGIPQPRPKRKAVAKRKRQVRVARKKKAVAKKKVIGRSKR